jgi:methionyl-tRNA formyltransferase
MDIVFFGTPEFALPALETLIESRHVVKAVVTAPDKPTGRGRKTRATAVKRFAEERGIPVLQPERLKDETFLDELRACNADMFVVVAFRILPPEVFAMPPFGSINLHGSLLPKYRGAAPMQWALINGERETGVTTFALAKKVDTGATILQRAVPIDEDDDLGTLHDKLADVGAKATLDTVDLVERGAATPLEQNHELATPAPKIINEHGVIDWTKPARDVRNLVRGLSPAPAARFERLGTVYKVYRAAVEDRDDLAPGEVEETKRSLTIGCGEKALAVEEIQPEGRKRMTAEEFVRGYSLNE